MIARAMPLLALILVGCSTSGGDSTAPAPRTVTVTASPSNSATGGLTAAPSFCGGAGDELGPSRWPERVAEQPAVYEDLDLRRIRSCGTREGDLWVDWTLQPTQIDEQTPVDLSFELYTLARRAQRSGVAFRDAHFRAYTVVGGADSPASVLRVADVEFSADAIADIRARDYDSSVGFWYRADVSRTVDVQLIGDLSPAPSPSD